MWLVFVFEGFLVTLLETFEGIAEVDLFLFFVMVMVAFATFVIAFLFLFFPFHGFGDIPELRGIVEASFPTRTFLPETDGKAWDAAYQKYLKMYG